MKINPPPYTLNLVSLFVVVVGLPVAKSSNIGSLQCFGDPALDTNSRINNTSADTLLSV